MERSEVKLVITIKIMVLWRVKGKSSDNNKANAIQER